MKRSGEEATKMEPMYDDLRARLQRAFAETGTIGVARRALRHLLIRSSDALADASTHIANVEFEKRIAGRNRALLDQNERLRGLHRGQRAFIIGNGPSLAGQDIAPLGDQLTFAVNAFWKHPMMRLWSPTYYLVTDGLMFRNDPGALAFWSSLGHSASTFFVPLDYIEFVSQHALLPLETTHTLALNGFLASTRLEEIELTRVLPSANSVVQMAMMVALYMGVEEIVLLGCDHNWLDEPASAGHFYSGKTADHLPDNEENPLISDYHSLVNYVGDLLQGYRHLEEVASKQGTRIINASEGGRLDVFERARLEDLLS